jgi:hypothetical protein
MLSSKGNSTGDALHIPLVHPRLDERERHDATTV